MKSAIKRISLSLAVLCVAPLSLAKTVSVSSPNGELTFSLSDTQSLVQYTLDFQDHRVIEKSDLGLMLKGTPGLTEGFKIDSITQNSQKQQWQQPWGERKTVLDHHNEMLVTLRADRKIAKEFQLRVRVFDDGIGFRYEVNKSSGLDNVEIINELTQFNLGQQALTDATAYWIPSRGWNRYEYVYNTSDIASVDRAHTPFTYKLGSGVHVSIHEAALVDYAGMSLDQRRPGVFKADLAPWSDGILVKTKTDFKTPWRTIQVGDRATDLVNSDLIVNLNEPNKLGDVSWINPGKYVGIWWGMHVGENTWGSGEKHGATTSEVKRYMDFAEKYGFDGVLVEGWNIGWDGDWFSNGDVFSFTKPYQDFDIKAIKQHSAQTGVKLIGHHETSGNVTNYRNQMQDAFALYADIGVAQVKTGYVADGGNIKRVDDNGVVYKEWHDGQFMVNEYLHNIELAAKYKLSINTHEPVKDTGLRRTYPNWIAREGARGQEYNAWGNPPNPPEHTAILPFTRMLSGPMDFTPGIFNMGFNGLDEEANRPQTTLAKQLALYVVIYSPIQMAADLPRHYEANLPAFQFIQDVSTDWHESIALDGEIGDYVVFARQQRDSEQWFVGGLTDEQPRRYTLNFNFLDKDKTYVADIYRDGENAHWVDNPYDIKIEQKQVRFGDTLELPMAASGGFAIRLRTIQQ